MAATGAARALQYGPTEGMAATKACIAEVMAAEGTVDPEDLLVTTGGQQVIDLVCKTLVDPGDVVVAEAPTYPGAVPTFMSYQADVVQIAMDDDGACASTSSRPRSTGSTPRAGAGSSDPELPEPGRRDAVAASSEAAGRGRPRARVARARGQPYSLRYEGDPLPTLSLDHGEFVGDLPRHVLEDPVARDPRRLDDRAGAGARR